MPRIYVQFSGLDKIGTGCKTVASKVDAIEAEFQSTIRALDWDIRFEDDINNAANKISRKLEQQVNTLKTYQKFIDDVYDEYTKLEQYGLLDAGSMTESKKGFDYGFLDIMGSFGNVGKIFKLSDKASKAENWEDWGALGLSASTTISKVLEDSRKYSKIIPMWGEKKAALFFLKRQLGLQTKGKPSTFSEFGPAFRNNLLLDKSPYNLKDAFGSLTGKNGITTQVCSWAGVVLDGIANYRENLEEQRESNGEMSSTRVCVETLVETGIDTLVATAAPALIGAAVAAATGVVTAPVVLSIATGIGQSMIDTEWISDSIIDLASDVGSRVADGFQSVAKWADSLLLFT